MAEPNPTLAQNGDQPGFFSILFGGAREQAPVQQAAPAKLSRSAARAQMKAQAAKAATPPAPQFVTESNGRVREAYEWEKTAPETNNGRQGRQPSQVRAYAAESRAPGIEAIERNTDGGRGSSYSPSSNGRFGAPISGGVARSEFGQRERPVIRNKAGKIIGYGSEIHQGVDIAAPTGTPVYAAADGVVGDAGTAGGYGKRVEIEHGSGYETRYAHLSGYAKGMRPGAQVHEGDVIGYVGSTGNSTGPHLHYEVRHNGAAINPRTVTAGLPGSNGRTMVADAGRQDARQGRRPEQQVGSGRASPNAGRQPQVASAESNHRDGDSGRVLTPEEMQRLSDRMNAQQQAAATAPVKKHTSGGHHRRHGHGTRIAGIGGPAG